MNDTSKEYSDLMQGLVGPHVSPVRARALIDAYAHRLAERQRAVRWHSVQRDGTRGGGPHRPGGEPVITTDAALTVVVHGHRPAPQGSKRHVGRGRLIEQSRRVAPWRAAVHDAVRNALAVEYRPPFDGPLSVQVVFTVRKPSNAPKRRTTWPVTRDSGDIDKLLRSTFDALSTGGAIEDDSRIVEVSSTKVYPGEGIDALEEPGAVIRIWQLPLKEEQ